MEFRYSQETDKTPAGHESHALYSSQMYITDPD
jgi:hypothetical protein